MRENFPHFDSDGTSRGLLSHLPEYAAWREPDGAFPRDLDPSSEHRPSRYGSGSPQFTHVEVPSAVRAEGEDQIAVHGKVRLY
jgi:hypothetical protein